MASPPKLPPKLSSSDSFKTKEKLLGGPSPTSRPVPKPRRNVSGNRASLSPKPTNALPRPQPKPRPRTLSKEKIFSEEGSKPKEGDTAEVFETDLDKLDIPPDADEVARMVEDMVEQEMADSPANEIPAHQASKSSVNSASKLSSSLTNQDVPNIGSSNSHNTNPIYDLQEFVGTRQGKEIPSQSILQPEKVSDAKSTTQTNSSDLSESFDSDDVYENIQVLHNPNKHNEVNKANSGPATNSLQTADKYVIVDDNQLFGVDFSSQGSVEKEQTDMDLSSLQAKSVSQNTVVVVAGEAAEEEEEDESTYEAVWMGNGTKKASPPSASSTPRQVLPPLPPQPPRKASKQPFGTPMTPHKAPQPTRKAPDPPVSSKPSPSDNLLNLSNFESQSLTFVSGKATNVVQAFQNESSTDEQVKLNIADRWGEYVGLDPQASLVYEQPPPLHAPPPLPEDTKIITGAPPVPPRPCPSTNTSEKPKDKPVVQQSPSQVFDDLQTPKMDPLDDDPFKYSDFATECNNFNRASIVPEDNWLPSTATTDIFGEKEEPFDPFGLGLQKQNSAGTSDWAAVATSTEYSGASRVSLSHVPPAPTSHILYSRVNKTPEPKEDLYSVAHSMEPSLDSSDSSEEPFSMPTVTETGPPPGGSVPIIPGQPQKKTERIGYLYKQGGVKANKGWRRRWVIFNGRDLRYYVNNRSQISKRVIPLKCMKAVETDVKSCDTTKFKFKLNTSLKDRVFVFASETLDDCLTWAQSLMAAIELNKKSKNGLYDDDDDEEKDPPDKEGFVRFENGGRRYYVCIRGSKLCYYNSVEDFELCSPVHEISMELASVKDVAKCKLQLSTHYAYFILSFDSPGEAQSWKMAIEEAVAEGLADDSVLQKVYENDSNRICADCEAPNPAWASINLGIVVCKKCAGIHRMFEAGISKIRSLRMDTRVWTPSLIELMKAIGNANANAFWEFDMLPDHKIEPDSSTEGRKQFILNKYKNKRFSRGHEASVDTRVLNEELLRVAATDDLLDLVKIVFSGADIRYHKFGCPEETAYHIAKSSGKRLLMEFLYQNGGESTSSETESNEGRLREDVRYQGYLYKTGPNYRGFDKRWCVLEHGALTYYQTETSTTAKDSLERQCIYTIQETSVEKQPYAFEISTNKNSNRIYLFAADEKGERGMWLRSIGKVMCPVAIMEHVGMMDFTYGGNFYVKDAVSEEWRKTWLMLSWRLLHYMGQSLKLEMLDLRKAISIKYQDMSHSCKKCVEMGPHFVINAPNQALYIQADLIRDTEKAFAVIEGAMKESGKTLQDQQLTSDDVPVIVDRCINHITLNGLTSEGIYRQAAQHSHVQNLLTELRKDARAVKIEEYSCNEVANAMKRFFRELEDSVFTKEAYPHWIGTAAVKDHNQKLRWYRYLLDKLPMVNYNTLKKLVLHLRKVSEHFIENKMNQENLATCFAPSMLLTEGAREGSGMGGTLSLEMAVLTDIIKNQDILLPVQAHQKKIEEQISKAEKAIKEMNRDRSVRQSTVIDSMIMPIHMYNIGGACETLPILSHDTAHNVIRGVMEKSKLSGDFTLCEVLLGGSLERPIPQDACVLPITTSWGYYGDEVSSDAKLCFKTIDFLEKLQNALDPCQMLFGEVKYFNEKKKSSKQVFQYKQGRLVCFKDSKGTKVLNSWNVEDLILYIGIDHRRQVGTKQGFGLTFIAKKEKQNKEFFGRSLLFPTEKEMLQWASALLVAQHPDGIIASFS